jgi:hypothetical protein
MSINLQNNDSPQDHLVYTNTDDVNVISVCEKTKWKYWWGEHYVVEITRYVFWKLSKHMNNVPGVEILLDQESPSSTTFGVSVSKLLLKISLSSFL